MLSMSTVPAAALRSSVCSSIEMGVSGVRKSWAAWETISSTLEPFVESAFALDAGAPRSASPR
jgi:hypothetical protein